MNTAMSLLTEIRDLLALQLQLQTPEKKRPQKERVKPQLKKRPSWKSSPYPIEKWKVGKTKIYPVAEKSKIVRRVKNVNRRMQHHFHLPNHFRHCTVLRGGRVYMQVWRDR